MKKIFVVLLILGIWTEKPYGYNRVVIENQPDYEQAIAGGVALGTAAIEGISSLSRASTANFVLGFAGTSAFVFNLYAGYGLVDQDKFKGHKVFVLSTAVILSLITIISNVISYPKKNSQEWYDKGCPSKIEAVIKPLVVLLLGLGIGLTSCIIN